MNGKNIFRKVYTYTRNYIKLYKINRGGILSNIIKFLICSITLTLLTSFTLHGYLDAREYAPSENDIKNDKYIYHFTDEDYEQYADIILDDSESPTITPRMAPAVPFLASAVFSILAKQ